MPMNLCNLLYFFIIWRGSEAEKKTHLMAENASNNAIS